MSAWRVDPYGDEVGVFIVKPSPHGRTWGEVETASEHMRVLIEAAPALLAALDQLLTASYAHGPHAVTEAREAREAARAALRAAKGEPYREVEGFAGADEWRDVDGGGS